MPATSFQYARPVTISGAIAWSGSVSDVDETPPFSDSDVMASPTNTPISGVSFPVKFTLQSATNPNYYTDGWGVLVRAQKNSASNTQTLLVEFIDNTGAVVVSDSLTLTASMSDFVTPLTALQASSLVASDYAGGTGGWQIRLTAPPPSGSGNNFVILSGVCLRLPAVGFVHLIPHSSGVGWLQVGAHSGSHTQKDSSGVGYGVLVGSETVGSIYRDAADGRIKAKL